MQVSHRPPPEALGPCPVVFQGIPACFGWEGTLKLAGCCEPWDGASILGVAPSSFSSRSLLPTSPALFPHLFQQPQGFFPPPLPSFSSLSPTTGGGYGSYGYGGGNSATAGYSKCFLLFRLDFPVPPPPSWDQFTFTWAFFIPFPIGFRGKEPSLRGDRSRAI